MKNHISMTLIRDDVEFALYKLGDSYVNFCISGLDKVFNFVPDVIKVTTNNPKKKGWLKCEFTTSKYSGSDKELNFYYNGKKHYICERYKRIIVQALKLNPFHNIIYVTARPRPLSRMTAALP